MNQPLTPRIRSRCARSTLFAVLAVAVLFFSAGCEPFDVEIPEQMIELESEDHRQFLAMTHDGVVVRARVIRQGEFRGESPRASHEFWVDALRERMRISGGYALLEERDVQSNNGHDGTRLEFGRDQDNRSHSYWLTLFVTDSNIHIIEAGGRQDRFERAQDSVKQLLSSYDVRR